MRVGFAGCHQISWHCLRAVAELCKSNGDELVAVFNLLPEKGAKHSAFVEFDGLEKEYGFQYHKVTDLAAPETLSLLNSLKLDAFFIIGWHKIVPQQVIDCAPYCLGMHSSLLPKNRGSSPINWQIIKGEKEGGMSFFHLTTGVDSGDVVDKQGFEIALQDSCADAYQKAAVAALEMLRRNWAALREKSLPRVPQDESQATLNPRRKPEDGSVDWKKSALELHNWVRALTHPYPGAFTFFMGKKLFLWKASWIEDYNEPPEPPGTIVSVGERLAVAAEGGWLLVKQLQFEGEPECSALVFSTAYSVSVGEKMG